VTERVLSARELNRSVLARQLLLERARLPIHRAVERIAGLQTQYAPSAYVGLWTRLENFDRDALTRALERRSVVQATLMRSTIHIVSRTDFWPLAVAVRRAQQEWYLKLQKGRVNVRDLERRAARLRAALAEGPKSRAELGELASGWAGSWGELVRVPPSGTWERRRADLFAFAEDWIGPADVSEEDALVHLVRRYLSAFGPASRADIGSWAHLPITWLKPALDRLELRRFRDEAGKELIDLPRRRLPDPETLAPVRFLPHWDANLLAHARRAQILPEEYRERVFSTKSPFSVGTVLVDGQVAGAWSVQNGRIVVEPYERLTRSVQKDVDEEAERLTAFHN
jgi:hypothetical protein